MSQFGSMTNLLYAQGGHPEPEVGMGATILLFSDRHAATIVEVSDDKRSITVQRDWAHRTDKGGFSETQEYRYEFCPANPCQEFTLRANGRYVLKGENLRQGRTLLIGKRDEYYDFTR